MKSALVLLASGFEEVEALTPVDYLRRAGIEVTVVGVDGLDVTGRSGIRVTADSALARDEELRDCIVVPGGKGASVIAANGVAVELIGRHAAAGRLVAAICAAPAIVLAEACGLLAGRKFTCYPGYEAKVPEGIFSEGEVVRDGNMITSRAAGTSAAFSLAIVEALMGESAGRELSRSVLHS